MNAYKRCGNRWSVNELLSLQREYELLEWTIQEIAEKHQRTVPAILFKLQAEGFIACWDEARGFNSQAYQNSFTNDTQTMENCQDDMSVEEEEEEQDCCAEDSEYFDEGDEQDDDMSLDDDMSVDDEESEVDKLTERVWNLETSVGEIGTMVKQMFDSWVSKNESKRTKRAPLRNY
jgi:hypothetical protein